ncbi:conserved hypothetical protein [Candidatus Koribacter versatilis Ellin345]|uniref:DUF4136 domain-containing protein n=1 Tax=Koribacter versatilis (strain Ellin345) TaxID=204669 RepID=Q1IJ74_KORVE|nr:DUF4136 domain-containing protein [Candidatus Koribacter versatilis]ABF43076.1 conserved hypothetical protein [Candidatus Koribacter versatilis Ellin345]
MRKISLLSALFLLLMCAAAVAQDVRYNFDKETDFSKFKTYTWVVLKDAKPLDDIQEKQVKAAVDAQLAQKGLTKTDSDKADLYVGYQAAVGQEKEFTTYNSGWGYGPGWYGGGWYGGGGGMTTGQTSTIYVGQLSIDLYNPAGHDLIWRGVVSKELDPKAKPEKREKNLNKAMTKLFKNFPPKPKS